MNTVTTTENLRELCIKNDWFTEGSNSQYEKMFRMNKEGASMEELATVIWLCSDEEKHSRRDILETLEDTREAYQKALKEAERDEY